MKTFETTVNNYAGSFPNATAINSSGAGTTDGSEYVAGFINNFLIGPAQALLDYCDITPNGVTESASNSQIIEALQKGAAYLPGTVLEWNLNVDPAAIGFRGLYLNGQGIIRASYPLLDANCYVGDANNSAVAAAGGGYYRADDAAGTIPNIAGDYLILPESRGLTVRGLDTAASTDPQGASRYLGDMQADAMQRITGVLDERFRGESAYFDETSYTGVFKNSYIGTKTGLGGSSSNNIVMNFDSADSTSPNTAKTDDIETRMANRSTKFIVIY